MLAAITTAVLVANVITVAQAPALAAPGKPPPLPRQKSVPVTAVALRYRAPRVMPKWVAPKVTLPAGSADVAIPSGSTSDAEAGTLPVWVGHSRTKAGGNPDTVHVQIARPAAALAAGVHGVLMSLAGASADRGTPVHVRLSYGTYAAAYGGDWAGRLRLVALPACSLTTPATAACRTRTPVKFTQDRKSQTLQADVAMAPTAVLAAEAGASGDGGNFAATSMSPEGSWQAGGSTDSFAYQYPFTLPTVPGGLVPTLKLSYSSEVQDGLTSSQNSQASVAGDGWSLSSGFMERSYASCSQNPAGATKSGDSCWSDDNQLTLSLNGQNSTIILDDNGGGYHAESDANEKIERLTGATNGADAGEYWRVTTNDGIQYYFGLNHLPGWTGDSTPATNSVQTEPVFFTKSVADRPSCYDATFAKSYCQEAYRWNLDYVVDPHKDVVSYFYATESNEYSRDNGSTANATYSNGARLVKVQYGQRDQQVYTTTPAGEVDLGYNGRCSTSDSGCAVKTLSSDTASKWPDVPYDQHCDDGASCANVTPSFWTEYELTSVQTSALVGAGLSPVDSWALKYSFPSTGEQPGTPQTAPALWLDSVTHTGQDANGGGDPTPVTLPPTVFTGQAMANRVDLTRGYIPFTRHRLKTVTTESGATITVDYSSAVCSTCTPADPSQNATLAYPVYWTPPTETAPILDYFNKYIVAAVTEDDPTGGSANDVVVTHYTPVGSPAWHHNDSPLTPAASRTWDDFRGYTGMTVTKGTAPEPVQKVTTSYFRGMGGAIRNSRDSATFVDADRYAGMEYEEQDFNGGDVVKDTITMPWSSGVLATHQLSGGLPAQQAFHTGTASTRIYTPLASGAVRETESDNRFDDAGRVVQTDDQADIDVGTDDTCTTTSYASGAAGILTDASEVKTVAVRCGATPDYPDDAISDVRTYYDNSTTLGAEPAAGDATRTDVVTAYTGSTPTFTTTASATFDQYGRTLTATDAANLKSRTSYTPAIGANPTSTTTIDPMNLSTKMTVDQARGLTLTTTDPAGYVTSEQYDALGRATAIYKPGSTAGTPSIRFEYHELNNAPSTIDTFTLASDGQTYLDSRVLYDAMLRSRETQTQTADGGRVVADTVYNTDGLKSEDAGPYYNSGPVSSKLVQAQAGDAGPETGYAYDQAGRLVSEQAYYDGTPTWETTHAYGGNFVTTVPPPGGTPTTTVTDALGNTTDQIQYHSGVPVDYLHDPASDYDDTHYTYFPNGKSATMADAAGNKWSWKYDLVGDVVEADDPDSGRSTYTYDTDRRVSTVTDARKRQTTTNYDHDGRKTGVWDTTSTTALSTSNQLAAWTYDTAGKGLPYSSTSYSGGDVYTDTISKYNGFGGPDTEVVKLTGADAALVPATGYTTYYRYTANGAPKEIWDPAAGGLPQETVTYGYKTGDPTGVVTSLSSSAWNYVSAIGYSEYGEPLRFTLPTAGGTIWQDRSYDGQTHNLTDIKITDSGTSGTVDDLAYTYGNSTVSKGTGLVTSIVEQRDSGATVDTQCYTYDYAARLDQAWTATDGCATTPTGTARSTVGGPVSPYWQSWTYDKGGNRSTQTDHSPTGVAGDKTTTYNYPAAGTSQPHTLTSAGGASYAYDASGNTTTVVGGPNGNQALNWTTAGNLDTDTTTAGTTQYVYDASGDLVVRRDPAAATLYLGDTQVVLDRSANTTSATRYYSVDGTTIASRTSSNKLTYLVSDRQGTTQTSLDATTQAVTRRSFLPFGQVRGATPTFWAGDLGFHSGTNDTVTGFENLGAREYDPSTGRFLSVDSVLDAGNPQQINGYDYADNDPITLSDPLGTDPCWAGGDGCSGTGHDVTDSSGRYYPTVETRDAALGKAGGKKGHSNEGSKSTDRPNGLTTTHNSDGSLEIEKVHIDPNYVKDPDEYAAMVTEFYYEGLARGTSDNTLTLLSSMYLACQSSEGVCTPSFSAEIHGTIATRVMSDQGCHDDCLKRYEFTVAVVQSMIGSAQEIRSEGGPRTVEQESEDEAETSLVDGADGKSLMCGGESFTADTPVRMANGSTKRIDQVKVGDRVLATDPVTGKTSAQTVTAVMVHHDTDLADLVVIDQTGRTTSVHTTMNHPVWDQSKRAFVETGRLAAGDQLRELNGRVTVLAVVPLIGGEDMYDLTVATVHTFYVLAGNVPVLVHNTSGWCIPESERVGEADLIAEGHAGSKHAGDFPGMSVKDLEGHVRRTMEDPARVKNLERGRKAYQGKDGSTIVIHDPNSPDGGTVFRRDPATIDEYWEDDLN
ncbi:polymorphic toxin-type HINT domain-containing protein [Actinoplanes sp. NPDC051411]|uniref:polymorphic toxin-type HINT domain-containing protein n=1 Tax=Actinoplanes sp. NPDC051411 TaxID=3155522 RepID=UPI00342428C4